MLIGIKDVNTTVQITAIFTNETGEAAAPDTSAKITIYPANSDTPTVSQTDMTIKNSKTGFYKYAWNISEVSRGLYIALFEFVDNSNTYISQQTILITSIS